MRYEEKVFLFAKDFHIQKISIVGGNCIRNVVFFHKTDKDYQLLEASIMTINYVANTVNSPRWTCVFSCLKNSKNGYEGEGL